MWAFPLSVWMQTSGRSSSPDPLYPSFCVCCVVWLPSIPPHRYQRSHQKLQRSLDPSTKEQLHVFSTSQVLIGTDSITNLHKLEQVSSDEGIGTLAENLLEALREHSDVNLKIEAARRETRAEKKRMAMAMRQKALGTLGMTVLV